jgi:hypothetical protein
MSIINPQFEREVRDNRFHVIRRGKSVRVMRKSPESIERRNRLFRIESFKRRWSEVSNLAAQLEREAEEIRQESLRAGEPDERSLMMYKHTQSMLLRVREHEKAAKLEVNRIKNLMVVNKGNLGISENDE